MPEKRSPSWWYKFTIALLFVCHWLSSTLITAQRTTSRIKEKENADYVESFSLCLHFACRFVSFGTDTVLESFASAQIEHDHCPAELCVATQITQTRCEEEKDGNSHEKCDASFSQLLTNVCVCVYCRRSFFTFHFWTTSKNALNVCCVFCLFCFWWGHLSSSV